MRNLRHILIVPLLSTRVPQALQHFVRMLSQLTQKKNRVHFINRRSPYGDGWLINSYNRNNYYSVTSVSIHFFLIFIYIQQPLYHFLKNKSHCKELEVLVIFNYYYFQEHNFNGSKQ